ncbi:MAG TPA: hypothetical protein PKC91_08015, partial [Ignavibacteria bacterium]|nr:hypothetical protein [Ignavibacteria bacterium]
FAAIEKEFPAIFHQREIFLLPGFSYDLSKEKQIKFIVKSLNNVLDSIDNTVNFFSIISFNLSNIKRILKAY